MIHAAAATVFWTCVAVVVWVYFGYPAALRTGLLGRRRSFTRRESFPLVSVIIPARNEESSIEAKIRNLLSSDYPRDRLEILIGSDGSSDRTAQIVERFASDGVGLISFPQHRGKSFIQNGLVEASSGSVLIFTDADCFVASHALRLLVANFADPRVGLVTACPCYRNADESSTTHNEGLYLRYETWLRNEESGRGILAMASGSLFAMRRSLWRPLDAHHGDDFVLPLQVARTGMKDILDTGVVAFTRLVQSEPQAMLRLKVRIVSKDFRALLANRALLNPFRYGAVAIALWSHKLLRWFVPFFLLALLTSNLDLLTSPLARITLALQAAFYLLALVGFVLRGRRNRGPWSVPLSFCVVNVAAALGILKCLLGRPSGMWETERAPSAETVRFDQRLSAD